MKFKNKTIKLLISAISMIFITEAYASDPNAEINLESESTAKFYVKVVNRSHHTNEICYYLNGERIRFNQGKKTEVFEVDAGSSFQINGGYEDGFDKYKVDIPSSDGLTKAERKFSLTMGESTLTQTAGRIGVEIGRLGYLSQGSFLEKTGKAFPGYLLS